MKEIVIGNCRLCGTFGEIVDSHIVPNFILKLLKDDRKNHYSLHPTLLTADSPDTPVQQAMSEYLLCSPCEIKFSKWEKRFSVEYKQLLKEEVPLTDDYFKQDWVLRLGLSLAWRATQGYLIKALSKGIKEIDHIVLVEASDFWAKYVLDDHLIYTGVRPTWWQTSYESVEASDAEALEEITAQPDGTDTYQARFCDYAIGPVGERFFLWYKIPFLVMTIPIESWIPGQKLTLSQFKNILHTRIMVTKAHLDKNTTEKQRQQRSESILKRTSEKQREAFFSTRFGKSAILDKQRFELKANSKAKEE